MAELIKASAGTGAIADGAQVAFTLHNKLFDGGRRPIVSCAGLAGAETVTLWVKSGAAWRELDDGTGTQVQFTATYEADVFNTPGEFGITKSATVGAITIRVHDSR